MPNIYKHLKGRGLRNLKSDRNTSAGRKMPIVIPTDSEKGFPLLQVKEYFLSFQDLVAKEEIVDRLEYIIAENRYDKHLRSYGLKPRQKILFCGPPGTGKTLSSKIISSVIGYKMVYVLFDSILSSYLGQTASNLRKIFDFIENGKWVVLFDEFDIIGKKRDDPYEHGEIKRVVNNFMQMIDNYEGESLLIAATNHQHMLDSAIWRRFEEIIYFDLPDQERRERLFTKYLRVLKRTNDYDVKDLANRTEGFSAADISQICEDALRRTIIMSKERVMLKDIEFALQDQIRRKNIIKKV